MFASKPGARKNSYEKWCRNRGKIKGAELQLPQWFLAPNFSPVEKLSGALTV